LATILIVDDQPPSRAALVTLLGLKGHRLLEASDGAEALAVVRAERPDLVIAAVLMPTMDGYELVRQLRADPAIAHTPVIFCTAHYLEHDAQKLARSCGVGHLLTRPADADAVLRTVELALGLTAPAPAPPQEEFDRDHLRLLTDKLSQTVEQLRKSNLRLSALIEMGLHLANERDVNRLLERFCHAARNLIGARYAVVGIVSDTGQLHTLFTSGIEPQVAARMGAFHPRGGVLDELLGQRRPRRLSDLDERNRPEVFPDQLAIRSFLAAPVVSPDASYGWACLADKIGVDAFGEEDELLLANLAAQVGRIYQNSRMYAQASGRTEDLEREVAERQRSEQALRESEERFRSAFEHTNMAMVLTDLENRFTRVNTAFVEMFGYSEAELLTMSLPDITHPDDLAESYALRETLLAGVTSFFQMEKRYLHKDGHVLWGLANVSLVRDQHGEPLLYVGQVQDVSERKRAEEELRASELRFRLLIDGVKDYAVFLLDSSGRIASWNVGAERIYACTAQDIIGWPFALFYTAEDIAAGKPARDLRQAEEEGRAEDEGWRVRMGGERFWASTVVSALHDDAGRVRGYAEIVRDMTERHRLEQQLQQAQKMEAVGRLAGGVAHDFNNLLSVINGYGDIVLNQLPAREPLREMVGEIIAAGERAAALTRQLLAFSKKQIVVPRIVDLNDIIHTADRLLRRLIGEDVELSTIAGPNLWPVKADPGQMEQILVNLAVNARDAMPRGGKLTIETGNVEVDELHARAHADARSGPHVLLRVRDTGTGMDTATQGRIFEPFFTTKGEKGTGIGLATVYGIVRQSGGHIVVDSEVGKGTVFQIYLPRAANVVVTGRSEHGVSTMPRGTETILLVEDEEAVRALSRHVLTSCGYTVAEAADGREALKVFDKHPDTIHLLLTDVIMPHLSGPEVAARLVNRYPGLKVLYCSGYTDDAVVRHGVSDMEVAFLQKPFSPGELARKVREVLDGQ
jgi:PAS domain S-box-containing protein